MRHLLIIREEEREKKKLKKDKDKEDKEKRKAEADDDKPKRRRKRGRERDRDNQGDASDNADENRRKSLGQGPTTRTRGTFAEDDPQVLVSGTSFPSVHQICTYDKVEEFMADVVLERNPSILRFKKGMVRKLLTMSMKDADSEEKTQFINATSKQFGMTHSNISAKVKGLDGKVRKNQTMELEPQSAMLLGLDLLMNGYLAHTIKEHMRISESGNDPGPAADCCVFDRRLLLEALEK